MNRRDFLKAIGLSCLVPSVLKDGTGGLKPEQIILDLDIYTGSVPNRGFMLTNIALNIPNTPLVSMRIPVVQGNNSLKMLNPCSSIVMETGYASWFRLFFPSELSYIGLVHTSAGDLNISNLFLQKNEPFKIDTLVITNYMKVGAS